MLALRSREARGFGNIFPRPSGQPRRCGLPCIAAGSLLRTSRFSSMLSNTLFHKISLLVTRRSVRCAPYG